MKPNGELNRLLQFFIIIIIIIAILTLPGVDSTNRSFSKNDLEYYKNRVEKMFYHAYDNYIYNAYPYDELQPITCKGFDTWGSYSLTLIDSLDMLIILNNRTEFERVVDLLVKNLDFDKDINVSVFETNIRIIGGLLSSHILSYRLYLPSSDNGEYSNVYTNSTSNRLDSKWPCDGPLLRMAVQVAQKILPAFNTTTGMPYGTVNLLKGVPQGETQETCVAGVGTFIIEFAALSRLTGDPTYETISLKAIESLWKYRSSIDLIGNHINVQTGKWTGLDATIGSGVDSYFEYLVKAGILLNKPELIMQFRTYQRAIDRFLLHDNWFVWSNMEKGQKTLPLFSSLEAFYPGLLTLTGDLQQSIKIFHNYQKIWRKYGGLPEFYNIQNNQIHSNRDAYPLRPELIESLMYIIRATNDDEAYYEIAVDYLESIESISRLECGFATVKDVKDHRLEDRMESFFLAETLKYLYLIFDSDNFLHNKISNNSKYKLIHNELGECVMETGFSVFNTEAHPIDGAALECCRMLNLKDSNQDEDINIFEEIKLDKLFDKYLELDNSNSNPVIDLEFNNFIQQEYDELKRSDLDKEKQEQAKFEKMCAKTRNSNVIVDEKSFSFQNTCSTNDTFKLFVSYLASESFFP